MAGGETVCADFDALHETAQRLMTAESESEICDIAVAAVEDIFDVPLAGLWLYDAEATELQQTAESERSNALLESDVVYRPGNSLSWEAFDAGEIRTYSAADDVRNRYNENSRIKSEIIMPLGEYGVMNVSSFKRESVTSRAVEAARLLATSIESALSKTEREHELHVKNDRLEEFVGIVSHDLRNPLTVADGNLELARMECENPHLDKVDDALDRMATLIDDLLTLAEQGYVVESRTRIDLESIADRAWENVHTPSATLETSGRASIFGDEQRLLQVFENLFRNAIDHVGEDVTIRVGSLETIHTSTRVSDAARNDGFFISDDGPGIPEGEEGDVFDTGHSTDSTGLGLAIVQRIVDAHGWNVAVEETIDGGARFEITGGKKSVIPFQTG